MVSTNMSNEKIIAVCQQLSKEGKEPSVALVKSRLGQPLPMPLIIAGIKQWRANPNAELPQNTEATPSDSAPTQSLEQRVDTLEQEVKELKAVIKKLQAESGQ